MAGQRQRYKGEERGGRRKRLKGTSIGKSETGKNGKLLWDHASVLAYLIFLLLLPSYSSVLLHP